MCSNIIELFHIHNMLVSCLNNVNVKCVGRCLLMQNSEALRHACACVALCATPAICYLFWLGWLCVWLVQSRTLRYSTLAAL